MPPTDAAVVEPRPAATVVLMRPGSVGPRGAPRPPPAIDGVRAGRPRLPGRRCRLVRCASRAWSPGPCGSPDEAAAALGGDLEPNAAIAAFIAAIREAFEEAGVLLADAPPSSPGMLGAARSALVGGRDRVPGAGRAARPHAPHGLAGAALALGHAAGIPAPVRRAVLRRRAARGLDRRRSRATRSSTTRGSGRPTRSRRWPTGTLGLWLPTSTTLQQLEHAALRRGGPRPAVARPPRCGRDR